MKKQISLVALCLPALFLAACGGGGSSSTPATPGSITSVTAAKVMYGNPTSFTITGTGLDKGVSLASAACNNATLAAGGSATQVVISCVPTATGNISVSFTPSGGTAVTSSQVVPLPQVTMKTSMGDMVIEMYPANAPVSVQNFLNYVHEGFYTNLIFHRVIANFVIQAGGYDANFKESTTKAAIKLESVNGLSNLAGTIAMARTDVANSATSQFFINTFDNTRLDGTKAGVDGYAVFGKVITGMSVVNAIRVVPTQTKGLFADVPVTPVTITSATQTQ
jgi:peptidyl-prolyl cis-trans isomerase A (cyclophilin A)